MPSGQVDTSHRGGGSCPDDLLPWERTDGDPEGTGICLSGGGLRSAAYSMGVLQALQEQRGLLYGPDAADFLAVVSGGSYVGATALLNASRSTPSSPPIGRNSAEAQHVERWAELGSALTRAAAEVEDPFEALRRLGLAYLRFAEEHPGHYRVLFSAAGAAGVSQERGRHPGGPSYSLLVDAIERCLAAGAPASSGRTSWFLALQILIAGHGLADLRMVQHFPFPWPPPDQLLDALLADLGLSGPQGRRTTKRRPKSAG